MMASNVSVKGLKSLLVVMALLCSTGVGNAAETGVCGQGIGEPPFLSYGVDANLLMLLDNSGSMLDTANINETKTTQCFDNSFNQANTYVGIYNRNVPVLKIDPITNEEEVEISGETAWYKWVDGLQPWKPGTDYDAEDADLNKRLVYENGIIYRAVTSGTSTPTAKNIYNDEGVTWERLLQPNWRADRSYQQGAFAISPKTDYLYYAVKAISAPISPALNSPPEIDTTSWQRVPNWENGKPYIKGRFYPLEKHHLPGNQRLVHPVVIRRWTTSI